LYAAAEEKMLVQIRFKKSNLFIPLLKLNFIAAKILMNSH
jgi:hypothetical protein